MKNTPILKLITSLDLSTEQRQGLENMGIRFFDASNWEVSEEQKNSLLSFGCQKVQLTEEQQTNLLNTGQLRTFSLTEPQKNILTSLAPLTREDKYSQDSLELLRKLNLKPASLSFLVNEEILPNPNLDFGEVKNPYLSLKTKLLAGEQKALEKQAQIQENKIRQEQVEESKKSIILSLADFAEEAKQEEKELHTLTYSLSDWVKLEVIKEWQKDILLTLGLKTVPKYNFFELLIFAVENILPAQFQESEKTFEQSQEIEEYKTQILTIIDAWKDNSSGQLKEELRKIIKILSNDNLPQTQQWFELQRLLSKYPSQNIKLNNLVQAWQVRENKPTFLSPWTSFLQSVPELQEDYQKYLNSLENRPITINKNLWEKFVSSQSSQSKEVLNNLDLEELINQQISKRLTSYQPPEKAEWEDWLNISPNFSERLAREWQDKDFDYQATKEWINIGLAVNDADIAQWLRDEEELTPEEILNNLNITELREQFSKSQEKDKETPSKPSTSRYDNLFANLSKEEAERKRKKQEREAAQKKLQEQERARRKQKLSEKDKKLKEDEERRTQERELAEQEEKKRRAAEEARSKSLQAEQESLFKKKLTNIEEAKRRAEENLANQIKQNELQEKKKRDEIEKMEKENQAEQARLAKQAQLIEEEKQKN